MRDKLIEFFNRYFGIGDSYFYQLTRVKTAFAVGTVGLDDFEELDEETVEDLVDHLLRELPEIKKDTPPDSKWFSVAIDPPKEDGAYLIYTKIHFTPDHVEETNYCFGTEISTYVQGFGFLSTNGHFAKAWTYLPKNPEFKDDDLFCAESSSDSCMERTQADERL